MASMQNASMVFDSRRDSNARLAPVALTIAIPPNQRIADGRRLSDTTPRDTTAVSVLTSEPP
jgi:hypothetical protein